MIRTRLKFYFLIQDSSDSLALSPFFSSPLDHLLVRCLALPASHCVSQGRPIERVGQRNSIPPFGQGSYRMASNNQRPSSSLSRHIIDSGIDVSSLPP